jgi:hypothetical protein
MRFDSDCLRVFEDAVRALPRVRIVITSTWRTTESLRKVRGRFSSDIALRVVGFTKSVWRQDDHARYREVLAYLRDGGLTHESWVAIDDNRFHFPNGAPVIFTDPERGFDEAAAKALSALAGSTSGR